ncbi:Copper amine oxidase 1 [Vanrija pseudolonga]|uniref:Amine oxidase n=1 Tax=Vanrija pseudolonga TaxID=143232 RepID=A0AAF1BGI0_9TREE|nr:Copper amine oxidase 1 [Vanrija pseudolonga]
MSTISQLVSSAAKLSVSPQGYHPLDPINAAEIAGAVYAIKSYIAQNEKSNDYRLWFKSIQLVDPPKKVLAPYLDAWHEARARGQTVDKLPRRAEALLGVKRKDGTCAWYEFLVRVDGKAAVEKAEPTPADLHVPADVAEMLACEEALMKNEEFLAACKKIGVPAHAKIIPDGWIYGADSTARTERYTPFMVYLSFNENEDSCHYSAPLPIVPVLNSDTFELVRLDYTPILGTGEKTILDLDGPFPWHLYIQNEYDYNILTSMGENFRKDLKPLRVVQPEGASFSLEGRVLRWQKWEIHVGFNAREGIVLSDVRYDGRKTFYRLSVSDMTVPYGDPRAPYHRKQAFDLGDLGAGICANELALGCDCLGDILYLDWDHLGVQGQNTTAKSVICIHEQDEGIGWKHTNYRTNNPSVTRNRVLVVQSILTVANYEYIFAWKFDQAAGVHLETRATGILSTAAILPGETSPYGNVVSPGVLATNHQHIFCVRIDPSIDGHNNTVVQEDSVPMPFDKHNPPADNRWGVGYVVEKTPFKVSGFADAAPMKNRVFKITNPNVINPISGKPVSYKLVPAPSQLMIAHPDSIQYARAEFGEHHLYVTKHVDGEFYGGGKFTNMSNGNAKGMRTFVGRNDNVENDDVVVWHSFGLTHNPRVEDFPVMPCEVHTISLKPNDFFARSPAIDVPPSTQAFNQSHLVTGKGKEVADCCSGKANL